MQATPRFARTRVLQIAAPYAAVAALIAATVAVGCSSAGTTATTTSSASATSVALVISPALPVSGSTTTFTATITYTPTNSATPTGAITFYQDSAVLGSANVTGSTATYTSTTISSTTTHTYYATYAGDSNYKTSTSSTTTITPNGTITTTPSQWTGGGDGIWRRDANTIYGEAATFDPCLAHQPGSGEYHYHQNPICLRYQAGDNITGTNVGTATATYAESTGTHTHSPILGWANDGYPVYGPYGYSTATDNTSGVRRMVSSYSIRTDNITTRTSLPAWAQTYQGITTLTSSQYGPNVSSTYPLGRYIEDYAYNAPGTTNGGDLDQYNGRYCVTPDFPNGTYAYFVTINASGAGAFPYYLGPDFRGVASGGTVKSISETVTTYYANHAFQSGTSTTPAIISWLLKFTNQLAQILYFNGSSVTGPVTTWTGNTTAVDADVQTISYSASNVYIATSGFASHMMGPWYMNSAHTQAFVNLPTNQNAITKLPIAPVAATTITATGGGPQGRWINGVSMFNFLDFASWSNSLQMDVMP